MGKLPEFKDWKWPWKEGEVNEAQAAEMIYNLKKQYEVQGDKLKTAETSVTALTSELDEVKASKSGADADGQKEIADLRAKVREYEKTAGKARPEDQQQIDRLSVALELGLSKSDASRLVGSTRDELLDDAKTFAEEHGITLRGDDDSAEQRTDGKPGGNTPVPVNQLRFGNQRRQAVALDDADPSKIELPAY